jgi:3',5'-cyclic AMP phosphodiesterase CpdA
VLFVMLDNNDVCYQVDTGTYLSTGDNQLLTGYSGGEQLRWLEQTLREASFDNSVDWIVVVMHQPAMSNCDADGSDLGIRQNWMPLFYKYGVDFVLAGHDHDYERSYVVNGVDPGTVLRPHVVSAELDNVDSDKGLVHLVIGTGGTHGHDDMYQTTCTRRAARANRLRRSTSAAPRPRPRTRRGPRSPTPIPPTRGASACSTWTPVTRPR